MGIAGTESGLTETIRRRMSVRSYDGAPITQQDDAAITAFMTQPDNLTGPFGGKLRLQHVRVTKDVSDKGIKLGTYGVIRNPKGYLIGVVTDKNKQTMLDFGFAFERLVLFLTARGIGTCWMGGSFNRNSFGQEIELGEGDFIPCVTPIGYPKEKQGWLNSAMRYMAKSDQRKDWESLFFHGRFGLPLSREQAGPFELPLEMVRLGPSASNKQPWRLVVSEDRRAVHFYLAHTPRYSDYMQRVDMGIAMCHFELTARETGVPGGWMVDTAPPETPDSAIEYIVSWHVDSQIGI